MSDDVIVLNEGFESRTSASGKQRVVITVKSEPLIFNMDPKAIGRPIALAIVHHLREKIKGITATAAPATLKARRVAERAFAAGKPWAMKRYAGGKTGSTPPNQTDRALNDSGRFANSITGNASSDGAWRINVAANRLSAETGSIDRILRRVSELVPEIARPELMLESDILRRGIDEAIKATVKKAQATTGKLQMDVVRGLLGIGKQVVDILDGLAAG